LMMPGLARIVGFCWLAHIDTLLTIILLKCQ
jgi:hypothetical protein